MQDSFDNINNFSWSPFRDSVFEKCPRAYYYRYYASQNGWRDDADDATQHLYLLKNLKSGNIWIKEIITKAIRTAALSSSENKEQIVKGIVLEEYSKGVFSVINQKWKIDYKNLNLYDIYYKNKSANNILEKIKDTVLKAIDKILELDIIKNLWQNDYLDFYDIKQPTSFFLNNLNLWTNISIAHNMGNKVNLINFVLSDKSSLSYQVQRLFIEYNYKIPQENIEVTNINFLNTEISIVCDMTQELLDKIPQQVDTMKQFIYENGSVCEDDFDKNLHNCHFCEFKEYCEL